MRVKSVTGVRSRLPGTNALFSIDFEHQEEFQDGGREGLCDCLCVILWLDWCLVKMNKR